MRESFDGIIIGAGHNALVLHAYLARAGLRVLTVERAALPGGGLATDENPRLPGFFHNSHSFFHRGITSMPWYRDHELERHGAVYIEPELNLALVRDDGRTLEWWLDVDRTLDSVASFSRRDARTLRGWIERFRPIVEKIVLPEAASPPLPAARRRELLARSALGREFLAVSDLSPLEFVAREFEHDTVRAGLLFFNGLREVDLRVRGFGHAIPALLAAGRGAQMCRGGSAGLARALVRAIDAHGGEVRCGVTPRRIAVRSGRAVGIELADGDAIDARFVVSGLDPWQTFVDLLGPDDVPHAVRERARAYRYNTLAPLFAVDLALAEPPRYAACEQRPELEQAFLVIVGLERFAQFDEIVRAHDRGSVVGAGGAGGAGAASGTVAWGACPTRFDPAQAPPGKHTAFLWEKVPFRLRGDPQSWHDERVRHGQRLLELWRHYAPNVDATNILDASFRSPLETVARLPNLREGDLLGGSFANGQVGHDRPFTGAGAYRAPVAGLYLTGSATHPGGNVTGLSGYNAAAVIAADLGVRRWWDASAVEELWAIL